MGQAKNRGTYEERLAEARTRRAAKERAWDTQVTHLVSLGCPQHIAVRIVQARGYDEAIRDYEERQKIAADMKPPEVRTPVAAGVASALLGMVAAAAMKVDKSG